MNINMNTFIIMVMNLNMNVNVNMNIMDKDKDTDTDRLLDLKTARMPDCLASSQSGTGMKKKLTMPPELAQYRTKPMQSSVFLSRIGLN
jgi:hypothetical protein